MNKCDFCREGPKGNNEYCRYRGFSFCDESAKRYLRVVLSRNNKTTTHNKNVNVHKNYRGGKKR